VPHPSRRRLLLGGAAALGFGISGCSPPALPVLTLPDPDDDYRLSTAESEQELIGLYSAVIAANPGLARDLKPIQKQHIEHLAAVTAGLDISTTSETPRRIKRDRSAALKRLMRAERSAAKARTNAAVAADDAGLAQLLARIGSSESAHQALLARTN
jgi:hypothetical protein